MEEKPDEATPIKERPGGRDILFGRGDAVYKHLGNT
eukprot:CAMPEP_0119002720 /NCGR_PEP_ID=MMETSP1176-20130426/73_1 /TAXON_ID=265551 /ORGANISM="Synedropsis recta cf, Strain CCMP1620" /LENGTH=35 /DNA_ID= /DNA_START= /DNA_END= /DNA_ORIENTATION=